MLQTPIATGWLDACSRCPDGRRYAALGDAVTAVVAGWIGRRILVTEGHCQHTANIAGA
jgi:hypothetical protein